MELQQLKDRSNLEIPPEVTELGNRNSAAVQKVRHASW